MSWPLLSVLLMRVEEQLNWLEQRNHNPRVGGSSRPVATTLRPSGSRLGEAETSLRRSLVGWQATRKRKLGEGVSPEAHVLRPVRHSLGDGGSFMRRRISEGGTVCNQEISPGLRRNKPKRAKRMSHHSSFIVTAPAPHPLFRSCGAAAGSGQVGDILAAGILYAAGGRLIVEFSGVRLVRGQIGGCRVVA